MKFKNGQKCDKCEKVYRSLKVYKDGFYCHRCWRKKVVIIGDFKNEEE